MNSVRETHDISSTPEPTISFVSEFRDVCSIIKEPKGKTILHQGEIPRTAFIIISGAVEVYRLTAEGQKILIGVARKDKLIGDYEAIAGLPCTASCATIEPTELMVIFSEQLTKAFAQPEFVRKYCTYTSSRFENDNLGRTLERFGMLKFNILRCLLTYCDENEVFHGSQEFFANLVGCSRQTLNSELNILVSDGLIEIKHRKILILNRAALQHALHMVG